MSGDTIGMMEGAFFVSKGIIIDWVNELLDVSAIYSPINSYFDFFPYFFSSKFQRLNSVRLAQFIVKSLMPSIQGLLVWRRLSLVPNLTMNLLKITKFCKMRSSKMV